MKNTHKDAKMIYATQSYSGATLYSSSLEDLHRQVCEDQGTTTPTYEMRTFDTREDFILRDIPQEFKSFISKTAWDRGHSAGEDEVNQIAAELADDLLPAINSFRKRFVLNT